MTDDEHELIPEFGLFSVDRENREITGLLIPWGERSRMSLSKTQPVVFNRGDVILPRDPAMVGLNKMHDRFDPLGHGARLDAESDPRGVVATFRVLDTPDGDAYLADPGNLRRLSPEVRRMVRRPDGTATAELTGAAVVDEGAFETAALFAIDHVTEEPDQPEAVSEPADELTEETSAAASAAEDNDPDEPGDNERTEPEVDAQVPNTVGGSIVEPRPMTAGEMFRAMAAITSRTATAETLARVNDAWGPGGETALFALNDVDYDGADGLALGASGASRMTRPQWLGEVLDGTEYRPIFADLFGAVKPLTSLYMTGWKWTTKPAGGAWSGNKSAVPSNAPVVALVSEPASRWAGGHDHAREHKDFGTAGYFESYFAAMVESYYRWRDEDVVLTELLAAATELEADNPAGLEIGAAMSKLIDGAASVVAAGLLPTFAILPLADWKSIAKTPNSASLAYLNAAIGLESGTLENSGFIIRPSAEVSNVVVGSSNAADVYELPGSPIRAEAENIAQGGIDTGLFGYAGLHVRNTAAIVEVTPYVA